MQTKLGSFLNENPKIHSILHGVVAALLVGIPLATKLLPAAWLNLTVGGLLVALSHYFETLVV